MGALTASDTVVDEGLPSLCRSSIYYLPGHGGRLGTGLGEGLLSRGFDVAGRETVGEFKDLPFNEQVALVAQDLTSLYWHEENRVVANSFGAYLFLHAQAQIAPYIGRVLLLSPIIGEFSNDDTRMSFIPPRAGRLLELATSGSYPVPTQCEIHVGEQDWQSNPSRVIELAGHLGLDVTVVPNPDGHAVQLKHVLGNVKPDDLFAIHGADDLSCAHSCITIHGGSSMVLVKTLVYHTLGTLMPYPSEDPPRLLEVSLPDRRLFMLLAFSGLNSLPVCWRRLDFDPGCRLLADPP